MKQYGEYGCRVPANYDLWMPLNYVQMYHWLGKNFTWMNYLALHLCLQGDIDLEKLKLAIRLAYEQSSVLKIKICSYAMKQCYVNSNNLAIDYAEIDTHNEMHFVHREYKAIHKRKLKLSKDTLFSIKIIYAKKSNRTYIVLGCAHIICDISSMYYFFKKIIENYSNIINDKSPVVSSKENFFYSSVLNEHFALSKNEKFYLEFWDLYTKDVKKLTVPFSIFHFKRAYYLDNLIVKTLPQAKLDQLKAIFFKNNLRFTHGLVLLLGILICFYTQESTAFVYSHRSGRTHKELKELFAPLWGSDLWRVTINPGAPLSDHFLTFSQEINNIPSTNEF